MWVMSNALRTLTENKHEPLLARLMKWRLVSPAEEAEKAGDASACKRSCRQPLHELVQTCVELVHAAKSSGR
jgi:hypothetical protein